MNLIKYHNDINKLKLGNFTENETDIFFSLLFKTKETNDDIIEMDFAELKALSNGDKNKDRFVNNILSLNMKLKAMSQTVEIDEGVYLTFSLFGDILTDTNKKRIEVPINKRFRYLINNLIKNYTVIDLKQLVSLKGNYSKILYRLLKQWESKNKYFVKIDEFRELMGIPKTYAMFNIRQKVLTPSLDQLEQYFNGLKLEEVKVGRNVSSLKFTWNRKEKKIVKINPIKRKNVFGEKELIEHEKNKIKEDKTYVEEVINKIEITEKNYEELYNKYLNEIREKHNIYIRKAFDFINKSKYNIIK